MTSDNQPRIARPESADIRSVWPDEAGDFTPWLADNLDWLDDLGLGPLSLLGVEVTLPGTGRSLDILAETADGRRVAIENQYGQGDHDHLTRGLAYAIGLEADVLVVIAERHRPEFRAIADYLNFAQEHMDPTDGISVLLVEVTVERVTDSYVPRFTTCSEPNEWRAQAQSSTSREVVPIDEFLAGVDAEQRGEYERLLDSWDSLEGGTVTPQSRTLTLSVAGLPKGSGPRSLFNLEPSGRVWINAGLIQEVSQPDGSPAPLGLLTRHLPGAEETGKGVWWRVEAPSATALLDLVAALGVSSRDPHA